MRKIYTPLLIILSTTILNSCYRPTPERSDAGKEPITTIGLVISNYSGFRDTFIYKVTTASHADATQLYGETIMLAPHTVYDVNVLLLDERPDSTRDVTKHIVAGADSHLFLFKNTPLDQPGYILVGRGNKDNDDQPFNQSVRFRTGSVGNSVMNLKLYHNPRNKNADWYGADGSMDAQAMFPIVITNFSLPAGKDMARL